MHKKISPQFNPQPGFVLIMALLYLLVISLMVMCGLNIAILHVQMTTQNYQKSVAFQNAESALIVGEKAVQASEVTGQGGVEAGSYIYHLRPETTCGVEYYEIDATGKYQAATSVLHSILAVPIFPPPKCPNPIPSRQRVGWEQLYS